MQKTLYSTNYTNLFYGHFAHRQSCFHCPYSNARRCSDITIGDYWGIEEAMPDFWDETGVSVVMLNTSKGNSLFRQTSGLSARESSFANCSKKQACLNGGFAAPKNYDAFWRDYHKKGFAYISRKYGKNNLFRKVGRSLKTIVKKCWNLQRGKEGN
jgi:hypothetical protein